MANSSLPVISRDNGLFTAVQVGSTQIGHVLPGESLATFKAIRYRHGGSVFADVGRETGGSAYEVYSTHAHKTAASSSLPFSYRPRSGSRLRQQPLVRPPRPRPSAHRGQRSSARHAHSLPERFSVFANLTLQCCFNVGTALRISPICKMALDIRHKYV